MRTVALLFCSNIFMTFAWYGHLKTLQSRPVWIAILASWGIAFFEYVLMVPANRIGVQHFTVPQLKVMQEVITMVVFAGFALLYLEAPLKLDYLWAALCLVGAAYFMFRAV
ncbi:MAG: DMT family protein [Deltaproteobacteria bacterium]|nr:DMT family protein [Deltaproteobacteria bacterium]